MFEREANWKTEPSDQIPDTIQANFARLDSSIVARTLLPWGEHCTECAVPLCYKTCQLYEPRYDGRCRCFVDGMVRVRNVRCLGSHVLKIRFKNWGQLWTVGNCHLFSLRQARYREALDEAATRLFHIAAVPRLLRSFLTRKWYSAKKHWAMSLGPSLISPDCFLLAVFNPQRDPIRLTVTIRPNDPTQRVLPYQSLIELPPGFASAEIPLKEIAASLDISRPFGIDLVPNNVGQETTLFFGAMDFVKRSYATAAKARLSPPPEASKKLKCVVWDLDNTLWNGVLIEDGVNSILLKPGIEKVIKTLDERGILQSIASKNNYDEAMNALKRFALEEYFLYPQISWEPKSQAISSIARSLNIARDTLLFVDDSEFERAQVGEACPGVRTLDAARYACLLDMPDFQTPATDESRNRRRMYQAQAEREKAVDDFEGDYLAFLKRCKIVLYVKPMVEADLPRVHELIQRTNQMNFSGNRYDMQQLQDMLNKDGVKAFVLRCEDDFGSYGTIGFCTIGYIDPPTMTDLAFSCRVQSKRVEHAFLTHVLKEHVGTDFHVVYRKTPRNAPSAKVFDDFGFQAVNENNGITLMAFHKESPIPDDGIVTVLCE